MTEFASNLSNQRKKRTITQEQLAELTGISIKTLSNYESGVTQPNIESLKKISIALNITIEDLIDASNPTPKYLSVEKAKELKTSRPWSREEFIVKEAFFDYMKYVARKSDGQPYKDSIPPNYSNALRHLNTWYSYVFGNLLDLRDPKSPEELMKLKELDNWTALNRIWQQTYSSSMAKYSDFMIQDQSALKMAFYKSENAYEDSILAEEIYESPEIFGELKKIKPKKDYTPKKSLDNQEASKRYKVIPRDRKVVVDAIILSDYACEVDQYHKTFTSKATRENYVEAHHLIPLYAQGESEYSLDVLANIVALCPNCHRKIHHAVDEEKNQLLEFLYERRKEILEQSKIVIPIESLKRLYDIE